MTRLLRRLRYLLQRDRQERVDDELQFHLEMKRRELEGRGLERAAAATAARRALGNLPLTRDHVRDVWIAPWLQCVLQDVRFAGRLLVKQRGFTLGVVLVLGIGIALTATGSRFCSWWRCWPGSRSSPASYPRAERRGSTQ